jgi:Uma2 family endonuclease
MAMATEIAQTQRRLFTVEEYNRMAEAGILTDQERVELIDGEILVMSPVGFRHGSCVATLTELLVLRVGTRARVWVQSSVRTGSRSKPQPDLALLERRSYWTGDPTEAQTLLIVEVADSSLAYDRTIKRRLYAQAGIPEVWIVDVNGEAVEVSRHPEGDGYRDVLRVTRGGTIAPAAFPDATIGVDEIFA